MITFHSNLIRWYNVQLQIPMKEENKFWYQWEKNRLFIHRLKHITK